MFKCKIVFIFIFAFFVSSYFLWARWEKYDFIDSEAWANQVQYFQTNDPKEFNPLGAYGHPGGPIIEGTIAFHKVLNIPYENSLVVFVTIFNAIIISSICALCFLLKKNNFWWIIVLSTLSLDRLYDFATPPTAIVSPLIVLLSLLTLYFYENKEKIKIPQIAFFAFIVGLAVATRADIGVFCSAVFLIFLRFKNIISWKTFYTITAGSFFFFVLFDPFMWFMPFQHIKDLISKIIFHYAEFAPTHMTFESVLNISSFAFVSIFLSAALLFMRKKIKLILPSDFMMMLYLMTFVLYSIFLTSHYQAPRYFQPIIFIWEVFLPLFIFNLTSNISFKFLNTIDHKEKALKIANTAILIILVGFQVFLFL